MVFHDVFCSHLCSFIFPFSCFIIHYIHLNQTQHGVRNGIYLVQTMIVWVFVNFDWIDVDLCICFLMDREPFCLWNKKMATSSTTVNIFCIQVINSRRAVYTHFEKEALAVTWACKKCASYIIGLKDLTTKLIVSYY